MPEVNIGSPNHEDCIRQLVEEFGADKEPEIRKTYVEQRNNLERHATVFVYIPLLAFQTARRVLQTQYRPQI